MTKEIKNRLFRWLALLLGGGLIWFICQVLAPYGNEHLPGMKQLMHITEAKDIDPGDFWYTDVEPSSEAIVFTTSSTEKKEHTK